jgi:patatin-like phospholipase/acyl hydrolase
MTKTEHKLTRILSIDGGGIRGIIPGQILVSLEEKLKKKSENPDARIADYFDFIAGTSTGGILTCAYLCPDREHPHRPKFTAQEVVNLYLERGAEIFSNSLKHKIVTAGGILDEKYPSAPLEKALNDYFGDTKLSQLLKPCLITSYDVTRRQGHFFTQHDAIKKKGWNYFVKDVARATSAAPTYFECSKVQSLTGINYPLIDGGVFVNNPALCAYSEVHHQFKKTAKEMAILSIGTGFERKEYNYNQVRDWGIMSWIKPLIGIMMSGVSEVVDYQLKQIYSAVKATTQYLRINTEFPINVNPDMDNASRENLNALKELGTETAQKTDSRLNEFVNFLIEADH